MCTQKLQSKMNPQTHGRTLIMMRLTMQTQPLLKARAYVHKVESTFDELESVLGIPEPENEEIGSKEDYEDLLELPTDPINFEAENWDDDPDGEGELDVNLGLENESALSNSNYSSATLSSKASKRSFDEVDSVGDEDGHTDGTLSPTSPGQKRSRTH